MKPPKHSELKTYTLPGKWESQLRAVLARYDLTLEDSAPLAKAVQQLSNFYIEFPERPTPYHERWAQLASLVYFFPLNYLRACAVVDFAKQVDFFAGLNEWHDFGSGLGPLSQALGERVGGFTRRTAIDHSPLAHQLRRLWPAPAPAAPPSLLEEINSPAQFGARPSDSVTHATISRMNVYKSPPTGKAVQAAASGSEVSGSESSMTEATHLNTALLGPTSLVSFSYSLVEVSRLPTGYERSEAILIIEPSTQERGRNLQTLRHRLLADGYHIWAPCTHQGPCPLLEHSEKDWCHQRIAFTPPTWWLNMEQHLPMRNTTLTFSYLLARKRKPQAMPPNIARVLGDWQREKGKQKQLLCRNSEREFLAVLKRQPYAVQHQRGDLIVLPEKAVKAGNELRCDQAPQVWQPRLSK